MLKLENIMLLFKFFSLSKVFLFLTYKNNFFFKKKIFIIPLISKKIVFLRLNRRVIQKKCFFYITKKNFLVKFSIIYKKKLYFYKNIRKKSLKKISRFQKRKYLRVWFRILTKVILLKLKVFIKIKKIKKVYLGVKMFKTTSINKIFKRRRLKKNRFYKNNRRWYYFIIFKKMYRRSFLKVNCIYKNFFIRSHSHRTEKLKKLRRK